MKKGVTIRKIAFSCTGSQYLWTSSITSDKTIRFNYLFYLKLAYLDLKTLLSVSRIANHIFELLTIKAPTERGAYSKLWKVMDASAEHFLVNMIVIHQDGVGAPVGFFRSRCAGPCTWCFLSDLDTSPIDSQRVSALVGALVFISLIRLGCLRKYVITEMRL